MGWSPGASRHPHSRWTGYICQLVKFNTPLMRVPSFLEKIIRCRRSAKKRVLFGTASVSSIQKKNCFSTSARVCMWWFLFFNEKHRAFFGRFERFGRFWAFWASPLKHHGHLGYSFGLQVWEENKRPHRIGGTRGHLMRAFVITVSRRHKNIH